MVLSGMSEPGEAPRPPASLTLELARADIGFAAAHFSVVGGVCERLHGHNYRVALRATGPLQADGSVVDFRSLKTALRAACSELDERMLLPTRSDVVGVRAEGDAVVVVESQRRFVFPRSDVCLLPISNTTCECLAGHLLQRVRDELGPLPLRLELRVEEWPGQGASAAE